MNYIYLHGFLSGSGSNKGTFFRRKFAELDLTLHTPDLNDNDFEHLTISGQLDFIARYVAPLEGDITLIGASLGAYLAALFAEDNERITRLVLLAPAFGFVTRNMKKLGPEFLDAWKARGHADFFHQSFNENRRLRYGIVEDGLQHDHRKLERRLPVLILHGLQDEAVDIDVSLNYLKSNPLAELILLHADHKFTGEEERLWTWLRNYCRL